MTWWTRLIGRARRERELEAELRDHFERQVTDHLRAGASQAEARRRARLDMGGLEQVKEACRDVDGAVTIDAIGQDVRYALRQLRRQPTFWATLVATLVVGIAASTLVFAIVHGVLLRPLPYVEADRLVSVRGLSYKGEFVRLREASRTLELGGFTGPGPISLTGSGEPVRIEAARATDGVFDVLRAEAGLGRRVQPGDTRPGAAPVVVLSDGLWRQRFDGNATVIGRAVTIDGVAHTIVGVMPAGFAFPSGAELWLPLVINAADPIDLWAKNARMVGRLRPGADVDGAGAEVRRIVPTLRGQFPWKMPESYGARAGVVPLRDALVGDVRATLLVLFGAIITVLLIVSVNVANLLLTRGVGRERELATRAAIGATRGRLVRQLVIESLTIALLGGAIGTALAMALLRVVVAYLPGDVPRQTDIAIDATVLGFALALSIVTGLVFGILPAWRATARTRGVTSLRLAGATRLQAGERRVTRALAVAQLSMAVVLVVSAALLARSLWNLLAVHPGFRADQLVTATVAPSAQRYARPEQRRQFAEALVTRLQDVGGVRLAAAASTVPFGDGAYGSVFSIEGRPDPATQSGEWPGADVRAAIGVDYLAALGTPIIGGRGFAATDRADAPRVAVVTHTLARRYWGAASPIGGRIRFPGAASPWITIVGIAADVKWKQLGVEESSFSDARSEWLGALFVPLAQSDANPLHVVVRVDGDPARVAANLRAVAQAIDRDTPVSDIATGEALVSASATRPRYTAVVLGGFAGVALLLGAIGVYGVVSYLASRRSQEFAVRLALGGSERDILRGVVADGLRLTLAGLGLGVAGALAVTRGLARLLFGIQPTDPATLVVVALLLLLVGLLASYLPARRAMRIDPMAALQGD